MNMMLYSRILFIIHVILLMGGIYNETFAWGPEGHKMVAQIAYKYLEPAVKDSVKKYLGTATMPGVSNWMDKVRNGDDDYDYMDNWHFINITKGKQYSPSEDPNTIAALEMVISELEDRGAYSKNDVTQNIKVLIHLMGDLHQPLHVG